MFHVSTIELKFHVKMELGSRLFGVLEMYELLKWIITVFPGLSVCWGARVHELLILRFPHFLRFVVFVLNIID